MQDPVLLYWGGNVDTLIRPEVNAEKVEIHAYGCVKVERDLAMVYKKGDKRFRIVADEQEAVAYAKEDKQRMKDRAKAQEELEADIAARKKAETENVAPPVEAAAPIVETPEPAPKKSKK